MDDRLREIRLEVEEPGEGAGKVDVFLFEGARRVGRYQIRTNADGRRDVYYSDIEGKSFVKTRKVQKPAGNQFSMKTRKVGVTFTSLFTMEKLRLGDALTMLFTMGGWKPGGIFTISGPGSKG